MLKLVRKHSQSWLIKAILWLVVGAFVGTIFYSWGMGGAGQENNVLVTVNEENITLREYRKSFKQMRDFYRSQMKGADMQESMLKSIKDATLENLINKRLLVEKARTEGLITTDFEVRERIKAIPAFQVDGQFKEDIYRNFLRNNSLAPKDFEEQTRLDLLVSKMENMVKGTAKVSEQEIREYSKKMGEKLTLSYLVFTGDQFEDQVVVEDEGLQSYFKENKDNFMLPEKRSAAYIFASADDFIKKAHVAEDEIEDYYYDNPEEFKSPKEVHARHILAKFSGTNEKGAPSEKAVKKAREKANSILKKLDAGDDFAELAKIHSDDPGSAKKGGDLGFFRKGMMVKPFEEEAFSLEKGETSGLVMSPFGYHIIKVEGIREESSKTLKEAKEGIVKIIKMKKGMRRAKRSILSLLEGMANQPDSLEKLAGEFNTKIQETKPLARTDRRAGELKNPMEAIRELFTLNEKEVGNPIEATGGYYLLQLKDTLPSSIPPLEEVKEKVQSAYKKEAARKLSGEKITQLAKELAEGKGLEEIGKKFNLKANDSEPMNRQTLGGEFRLNQEQVDNLFQKEVGGTDSFQQFDSYYLYTVKEKTKMDDSQLQEEKEKFRQKILGGKKESIFTAWLKSLRKEADVQINSSLLD